MAVAAIAEIHGVVKTDFVGENPCDGAILEHHASTHRYSFILGRNLIVVVVVIIDGLIGMFIRFVLERVDHYWFMLSSQCVPMTTRTDDGFVVIDVNRTSAEKAARHMELVGTCRLMAGKKVMRGYAPIVERTERLTVVTGRD